MPINIIEAARRLVRKDPSEMVSGLEDLLIQARQEEQRICQQRVERLAQEVHNIRRMFTAAVLSQPDKVLRIDPRAIASVSFGDRLESTIDNRTGEHIYTVQLRK